MQDKWLFLDDSGQLSNSGTHNYFIYGGIFIENKTAYDKLIAKIKHQRNFFKIDGEIKGSNIKIKHRKKILEAITKVEGIYEVFLIEKIDLLNKIDFSNPEKLRYHKNYLIKRIIEELHKSSLIDDSNLHIKIDLESLSSEKYRDHLENHLNDYWNNIDTYLKGKKYKQYIPKIKTKFYVQFLDSKHHIFIQVSDLLANTKYRRYKEINKCCSEFLKPKICLKVPKYFTSGKNSIDIKLP